MIKKKTTWPSMVIFALLCMMCGGLASATINYLANAEAARKEAARKDDILKEKHVEVFVTVCSDYGRCVSI